MKMARSIFPLYQVCWTTCLLIASIASGSLASLDETQSNTQKDSRPNIVILMSDDQDLMLGSMDVMHYTRDRIISQGATFQNAFTTSPICCPSRSSFLTGIYSHNHNVLTNNANCSSPAWRRTHETRTFATYLNASGYSTGYFGKYLNEYDGTYTPPGWQYWMGLLKNTRYYNYTLRHNDRKEQHKDSYEKDYFTDLIVNRSMEYFRNRKEVEPDKPILSFLSFPAPHGSEDGAPQYQHLYAHVSSHITPSFDYGPNTDKHWIVARAEQPMDEVQHRFSVMLQQKRLQTLRSVDDGVERFVQMLDDIGQLNNTYILYTSDHGFHIGQFRLAKGKSMPYDFDIRIPFYLRGPDIPIGINISDIVLNIDIAPTLLGLAGVEIPEWMDGRNFMPLITKRSSVSPPWRDSFLIERGKIPHSKIHMAKPKFPSKQEKVIQTCLKPEYKHPCEPRQEWTCAMEDGIMKMRKCSKYKSSLRKSKEKKYCSCAKKAATKALSAKCRRGINKIFNINRNINRRRYRRGALSTKHYRRRASNLFDMETDFQKNVSSSSDNEQKIILTPQCAISLPNLDLTCSKGSRAMKPGYFKKHIRTVKLRLRLLKVLSLCGQGRPKRPKKCKCALNNKKPRARQSMTRNRLQPSTSQPGVHPMKLIYQEIREEHSRRLQEFVEARKQQQEEKKFRKMKKKAKSARRTQPVGRCSNSGMTCFKLHRERWVTKPVWDGPDRCYCTNANNNTYWCVRIINETSNLLYCEFITGFVEYYDLRTDPHQLSNTYHELTPDVHTALHSELAQLRVCKGARSCHVSREKNPPASTTSTTSASTPSPENSRAKESTPSTTPIVTTTDHIPTNYPLGSNYNRNKHGRRRNNRRLGNRRITCSALKRKNYLRWLDQCRKKNKSKRYQRGIHRRNKGRPV